jgi:hypothetical protein
MKITPHFAAGIPWVTRLLATQECDAYRWSHMTAKALRDPDMKAAYKCRC